MDEEKENKQTKTYFYISLAACIFGFIMFGITFIPSVGIYGLISSILLGLTSLAFARMQKKKFNFKGVFYAQISAYILLGLALALFIGGIIYSAV